MRLFSLRFWRTLLPLTFLAAVALLLWQHHYPLAAEAAAGLLWLSRLDPLLLLAVWRAEGVMPAWALLPLAVAAVTLAAGRVFCGWLCPVGGLLAQIPVRRGGLPARWLAANRYLWLAVVLVLLLSGSNWPLYLTPFHILTAELTRLWQGKMPWLLAAMLAAGVLFFPRFWCVCVCPTGLLLAALSRWRPLRLTVTDDCAGCGVCEAGCRMRAIRPGERRIGEDCGLCGRCWTACPTGAVRRLDGDVSRPVDFLALPRRQLIKGALGAVVVWALGRQPERPDDGTVVLRPPGALPEADFVARCSRCGRCMKVCPQQCLAPLPLTAGLAAFLTPGIAARRASCELCMLCQEVCPTGAIGRVPVAKVKMGVAVLNEQRCFVWVKGEICLLCRERCPQHAILVDSRGRPFVDEALCVGCGACENGCPLDEAAIVVRPAARRHV
jgi:MauM/NapG family ferredoxin protein